MAIELLDVDDCLIPCFVCDWCGERIERSGDGEVWWPYSCESTRARPRFAHKNRCLGSSIASKGRTRPIADLGLDDFLELLGRSCPAPRLAAEPLQP